MLLSRAILESAVTAPINEHAYVDGVTIWQLAATYIYHIAKDHAFQDGNKRAAAIAGTAFLYINGYVIEEYNAELQRVINDVADHHINRPKSEVAAWLRANASERTDP